MKRFLSLLIIAILFTSCSVFNNEDKIVNLEGKRQKLDYSKHKIYVFFSTLGCHDCHNKLNEYFENNNFYDSDSIEIIGYIGVPNGKIKDYFHRKSSLISFKTYYPNIKKVYFTQEDKDKNIRIKNLNLPIKIPNYAVPSIVSIKKDSVVFVGINEIFKTENKRYIVKENLKDIIVF